MYLVCFIRQDDQPDEEYIYNKLADAEYHFNLFERDESGLYKKIQLIHVDVGSEEIIKELVF